MKIGYMVNYEGKFIACTPPSASDVMNNDGNLLCLQLDLERNGRIKNNFHPLLIPQDPNMFSVAVLDRGYNFHRPGDRQTQLTLEQYFRGQNNARYLVPSVPGSPILDRDLRYVPSPHPILPNAPRTQMTAIEANNARLCTMIRWVIEAVFGGLEQYRIAFSRITDTHWLKAIGDLMPENPDVPKLEMIFTSLMCFMNRNHKPYNRDMSKFNLPPGVTEYQFGRLCWERMFLPNEFDPTENIFFSDNFQAMYNDHNLAIRLLWIPTTIDDPGLDFAQFPEDQMIYLTYGDYAKKNTHKYTTLMREQEIDEESDNNPNWDIEWDLYHTMCSDFPEHKHVLFKDEVRQPQGWDAVKFNPWFPRRIAFTEVPSLHKGTKHKVVLNYIPASEDYPENFVNRFGFPAPLDRLVGYACKSPRCPSGYRTFGACGHVATIVACLGIFRHDNSRFKSTHGKYKKFGVKEVPCLVKKCFAH